MKFLSLFIFFILTNLYGINIDSKTELINISPSATVFFENEKKLSYEEVSSNRYNHLFETSLSPSISAGYQRVGIWIRFSLYNTDESMFKGAIELPIPWINNIDVYIQSQDKLTVKRLGASLPFSTREVNSKSFYVPIEVKQKERLHIYMRFSGTDSMTIAPFLYSQKVAETQKTHSNIFNGALIGIFVVMILYYLIIAIMLKDMHYFRYLFYLVTTLFFMGTYYGYNLQLFWPDHPEFNTKMVTSTVALSFFAGLLFARNFLNTKKTMPKFDLFLKYLMYTFFTLTFLGFLIDDHLITVYAVVFLVTFYSAGLLFASFRSWQLKVPGSGFFILAWTFSVVGSFLASIMVQGYMDYSLSYYHFYGVSTVADIILLAFALAARIQVIQKKLINKEKEISQITLREKARLEKLVEHRTIELKQRNAELEKLSMTDRLTGLYNRMKLDTSLEDELKRAKRYDEEFGLIMLDIDFFKEINDTYGHQIGDIVLIEIAKILSQNTRETDIAGRWGGEEFLIICPQTDAKGTYVLAQSIREKIVSYTFTEVGKKTASFGTTVFKSLDTSKEIIKRADDALYEAKSLGRNCIVENI